MAALDGRFHCAYCVLAVPYPNFPDKHLATPLVTPQRFLEYARASGRLEGFEPPKGVLLIYKRSLMASLRSSAVTGVRRRRAARSKRPVRPSR